MRQETYKYLKGRQLQKWFSITIETYDLPEEEQRHTPGTTYLITQRKKVVFNTLIHVNRHMRLNLSFSGSFSDQEILLDKDLLRIIHKTYGSDIYSHN
jgi:hypothetical protein